MIRLFDDGESLSRGVAEIFADAAERAVASRGSFSVLVSGGETPRQTYALLAREPFKSRIPWERLHLFWGDERCVPPGDPRSNALMLGQTLLKHVPLPEGQVHPIICHGDAERAAGRYEEVLRHHFSAGRARFDLVMLGLGEDGHTASLFPDSGALDERHRWVVATRRPGEEIARVTLTAPALNHARMVLFLVAGAAKAPALQRTLEGPRSPAELPAQLIGPDDGTLLWCVDTTAAGMLPPQTASGTGDRTLELR